MEKSFDKSQNKMKNLCIERPSSKTVWARGITISLLVLGIPFGFAFVKYKIGAKKKIGRTQLQNEQKKDNYQKIEFTIINEQSEPRADDGSSLLPVVPLPSKLNDEEVIIETHL